MTSSTGSYGSSGLIHHTWTLHAVSPVAYYTLRPTFLESMLERDLCFGGDYCHVKWFTVVPPGSTSNAEGKGIGRTGRSVGAAKTATATVRKLVTDHEILFGPHHSNLHVTIDLYVDEKLSASVTFCFVELSRGRISSVGNFSMVRGLPRTYQVVWDWFELKTGCAVSRHVVGPTSASIAECVSRWTLHAASAALAAAGSTSPPQQQRHMRKSNRGPSDSSTCLTRPLVLTWTPPRDCRGRGIDTCSTVVTPKDLDRLCHDLRSMRIVGRDGERASPCPTHRRKRRRDTRDSADDAGSGPLPILGALVAHVSNEMGLDLRPFSLSHATCSVACLGSDGRCKPLCDEFLLECLLSIRGMVGRLHPSVTHDRQPGTPTHQLHGGLHHTTNQSTMTGSGK